MKENKSVGPNLKSYYYYTNEAASNPEVKGVIVVATGIEATGALYDEIGDYLDTKGYALYAIDEWGYAKTGKLVKSNYKNWKRKQSYFAAYNVHALTVLAKREHPNSPIYLLGNDFGAMLSLFSVKEFPEVVDKVITIGWGTPRIQDFGFLIVCWLRKLFLYDNGTSKMAHFNKNRRLAVRFELNNKYAWLSSDANQVNKIREAGYIDEPGTVGHYFYYYARKVRTPILMSLRKCDKNLPMLFMSGEDDLLTKRGRKTKALARHYKHHGFKNVTSLIIEGRHELLFEKNRFENVDTILNWLETGEATVAAPSAQTNKADDAISSNVEVVGKAENNPNVIISKKDEAIDVAIHTTIDELQEADDLLIKTDKKDK